MDFSTSSDACDASELDVVIKCRDRGIVSDSDTELTSPPPDQT